MKGSTIDKEKVFTHIFNEYEERLYIFIVKILHSEALAKDMLQDVFLTLWNHMDSLGQIENMNAYLYKITENKVYNQLRKTACDKEARAQFWILTKKETQDHSETIVVREYEHIIEHAIENLPPQRKQIYLLSKREGMKQSDIASHLHISPNTVRNHLAQAYKQIGVYLKQALSSFLFFL